MNLSQSLAVPSFDAALLPDEGWDIWVETSSGDNYPVRVGTGILDQLPALLSDLTSANDYALIADERVFSLHGERVEKLCEELESPLTVHTFPSGERNKNRSQWAQLTDQLLTAGVGRDGCVIALGGGVAGDLAGFVAASYMRGIPVVQIPTTLVAMVDASVGGKTGVDVPLGKNLVGAFHPPKFVLADPDLCLTLPRAQRSQGLAEAVKHGAILDLGYFEWIDEHADLLLEGDPVATATLVGRSVQLKAAVVSEDEKEAGLRQILNFGHTLGHALEAASDYRMPHGDAVSLGMVLEARLGERVGVTTSGVGRRLSTTLEKLELPTSVKELPDPDRVIDLSTRDKKVRRGASRYVFVSALGHADPGDGWSSEIDITLLREFLVEASSTGVEQE